MRIACSALLIAGAALFAGSSGAIAAPASGGAIKAAAEEIGVTESVHCRPFRHAHPHWHRWGHGCRGAGLMIYERGPRFRHRFGVREEFRGGFRTRERAGVTIRGGCESSARNEVPRKCHAGVPAAGRCLAPPRRA